MYMYPSYSAPSKRPLPILPILLVVGLIIAVIVAVVMVVSASNSEPTDQMKRLTARLDSLQAIIKEGQKNTQNADLKKITSDATLLIATSRSQLNTPLQTAGADKADKAMAAEELGDTLATLTDAKINGRFDEAYYRALYQKLDSTLALMREIREKTSRKALKTELEAAEVHVSNILDQLAKLN